MNLCEAFNRINRLFGANRVSICFMSNREIRIQINGFGQFLIRWVDDLTSIECQECFWPAGKPMQIRSYRTPNSTWLTGVANGLTRDAEGNMVKPSGTASSCL